MTGSATYVTSGTSVFPPTENVFIQKESVNLSSNFLTARYGKWTSTNDLMRYERRADTELRIKGDTMFQRLDDKELDVIKFVRNEIRLEEKIINASLPYLERLEQRKRDFKHIQNDFPAPDLIQSKIKDINTEEETINRQVNLSKQMLLGHITVLRNLIEDKTQPVDIVEGARSDINRVNRYIGGD